MRGNWAQDGGGVSIIATLEKLQQAAGSGAQDAAAFSRPGYGSHAHETLNSGSVRAAAGAHEKR